MIKGDEKESIRHRLLEAGACAVGFAHAEPVVAEETECFRSWLDAGKNAGMDYMHNYPDLRKDPRTLLEGAKTVISLAFSYKPEWFRSAEAGIIACYAYGKDYHKELRRLLKPILRDIGQTYEGAAFRICIDSAPIHERYWAVKAGIGFIGDNGCVIIPGFGSMVFLCEILTNMEIEPDKRLDMDCGHCGACVKACPGKALGDTLDCRRCISYLTIEHRGGWNPEESKIMQSIGAPTIFGCDKCLRVCPHNHAAPSSRIDAFKPLAAIESIRSTELLDLANRGEAGEMRFREKFNGSPLLRAGLHGLVRNISTIDPNKSTT